MDNQPIILTGKLKDYLGSFAFILPAVTIFGLFYVYPFVDIFHLSMHAWDGLAPTRIFVKFENFIELFGDEAWWASMRNAFYITFIALTFQNGLAFFLALACDRNIRMKGFYRVVFFLPPVLSQVVVGLIWRWILYSGMQSGEQIGLLNFVLNKIGLSHMINNWLSNPDTALTCIAVVHSWMGFGWGFILLLAGLKTIDRQLYEAAKVDGAGMWHTFRHVTVPMMLPVILVVAILTVLGSMQSFILVMSMVGQGLGNYTEVPVTRILIEMIGDQRYGYACAMGINFAAILIVVSLTFKLIMSKMKQA